MAIIKSGQYKDLDGSFYKIPIGADAVNVKFLTGRTLEEEDLTKLSIYEDETSLKEDILINLNTYALILSSASNSLSKIYLILSYLPVKNNSNYIILNNGYYAIEQGFASLREEDIDNKILEHNTNNSAHKDIRIVLAELKNEIAMLKLKYDTSITENSFSITFINLTDIILSAGVWNKENFQINF